MEVYTLDPLLRREAVIDRFESLIWTERYDQHGDFELEIHSTLQSRNLLKPGTWLAMNESLRVARVEVIEDATDSDGKSVLSVKGRTMEALMYDRAAFQWSGTGTENLKWSLTGTPGDVARGIFKTICIDGTLSPLDIIPFVQMGTFMPASNILEPIDPITIELEPTTVYEAIANLCDVWGLGFRILRQFDTSKLYFDIYTGSNRTTSQNLLPPVVFTPELDNLQNTKELTTIEQAKNVAYVFSPAGHQIVYAVGVDPEVEGFERRIVPVYANDVTPTTPDWQSVLIQKGTEELAKHRIFQAFDGEITQNSQYKYGTHYHLGDLVDQRNKDGVANVMRVTEQIFVQDAEGERAYPTLSVNQFVNTGSWLSWAGNKVWTDYGATEYWETQP